MHGMATKERGGHQGPDRLRERRAVPAPGLHRHRPQADRRRGRGAVRLALPLLPRRQGAARRRGDPHRGASSSGSSSRRVADDAPDSRRACATSSTAPRRRWSTPTTPTPARSRRSRSRSRARTRRCARRRPTSSRAGSRRPPSAGSRPAGLAPRGRARSRSRSSALLEGAFVLSRAARSTEPLKAAGATATAAVRAALAESD